MSKEQKILMIGAGWEQFELVKQAKELGLFVIASHPRLNNDGFALSDRHYIRESDDIQAHLNIASEHSVQGIVTDNCDYSYYTSSVIASKLGLHFSSLENAISCVDKTQQREKCSRNKSIHQPKFKEVRTLEEYTEWTNQIGYPYIVKPVDSRGTFGVTIVRNESNAKEAFFHAVMNSPSKRIICEEFIEGTLVTVDGFCFSNGHKALAVASRIYDDGPHPVTNEITYPAEFPEEVKTALLINHDKVVTALGYNMGHTHGEYILSPNGTIYLVECTNRGGGVFTSSTIVPHLTGINLNKILIEQSLGKDEFQVENKENYMERSVILAFLNLEAGKVIKSINVDELTNLKYVLQLRSIYEKNDMVESVENCASRHIMVVITGDNLQDCKSNFKEFKSKLEIKYYA
ncbi:MAG: ATP-grasp domain-containing protein [Crocinitomicaceae bacterium]